MSSIKVKYSQYIPSELLNELRSHYDLSNDASCVFFKSGLNDIYRITQKDETYFLRVSLYNVYNTPQIEEEIGLIIHLINCGLSVVRPVQCKNGKYVLELNAPEGMRQAVLFREIEQYPSGDSNILMKNLGELLAKIHSSSLSFTNSSVRPLIDKKMLVEEPRILLRPYLEHRNNDLDYLNKTADQLWSAIITLLSKHDEVRGFCHGDIQPNNYYFQGEAPVLFDFDCMGYGYFMYDLGVLLANLSFYDNDIYQKDLWRSVLEGYRNARRLNDDEEKAIYIFAALHLLRVLSYHAKCREGNQGAVYFMTDHHLDTFFGAYRRLTDLANEKASLSFI